MNQTYLDIATQPLQDIIIRILTEYAQDIDCIVQKITVQRSDLIKSFCLKADDGITRVYVYAKIPTTDYWIYELGKAVDHMEDITGKIVKSITIAETLQVEFVTPPKKSKYNPRKSRYTAYEQALTRGTRRNKNIKV